MRWRRTLSALPFLLVVMGGGAAGCEALVPNDVPSFSCAPGDGACPQDQVCFIGTSSCVDRQSICGLLHCPDGATCDPNNGLCVTADGGIVTPILDAGPDTAPVPDSAPPVDTYVPDTTPPPVEAGTEAGSCRGIGCRCAGPSDCDSAVCGDTLTLTGDVIAVTKSNVCAKPCCTSLDCDTGSVCFAAGTGGNYCVVASVLGRTKSPSAVGAAGAQCSESAQCASGLCTGNICVDTCCTATACAGGTACAFGAFPGTATASFDKHETFSCKASTATGDQGASCNRATDCKSALCESTCAFCSSSCLAPCRGSAECGAGYVCADVSLQQQTSTNDVGVSCYSASPGNHATGASCAADGDCRSGWCDTKISACRDVCFADADCAGAPSGWHCAPTILTVTGGGSFSVLACGP
jgi:hypothetical protein